MASFQPSIDNTEVSYSSIIGRLEVRDSTKSECDFHDVFCGKEILVGRDPGCCQLLFEDLTVSCRHLKIYSVIYDDSTESEVKPLVYAEDLSSNGSYWNGSLIGRGNNGVLLSNSDEVRISQRIKLIFHSVIDHDVADIDEVQQSDMKHFEKTYHITTRKLGTGRYGVVYLAVDRRIGRQLACKVVDLRKVSRELVKQKLEDLPVKLYCEVDILKDLNHPNIIRLEKVFFTDDTLYIFEELIAGGDLFSYILYKGGHLHEAEAGVIIRQVTEALKYLHDQEIVHRDVKPENLLIASLVDAARVVLTDFGSAVRAVSVDGIGIRRMGTLLGTPDYVAPEVLGYNQHVKEKGYTKAVDMWSLGCVAIALLTGAPPFADSRGSDIRLCVEESVLKASAKFSLDKLDSIPEWTTVGRRAKAFVRALLLLDEQKRMTAPEALNHEWFTNIHHKASFDAVYDRAIRDWKPTKLRVNMIERLDRFVKSKNLPKSLPHSSKKKTWKIMKPIEPHFYPIHRRVNQILSPHRQRTPLPTIMEAINEGQELIDQPSRTNSRITPNHSETTSACRYLGGIPDVENLKTNELNQACMTQVQKGSPLRYKALIHASTDDSQTKGLRKKAGDGTQNSEEKTLLSQSQSSISRSSLALRKNESKDNIIYTLEELGMWAELDELSFPDGLVKGSSAPIPGFHDTGIKFEGSTLEMIDPERLGTQGHVQHQENRNTADTYFIPVNRRQSIKLGDLDDRCKGLENFHHMNNPLIHESGSMNEQLDFVIPDSQPTDRETSPENRKRPGSSIIDGEEASIYTEVGKERRLFRTARSFGQAVTRKRAERELQDKKTEISADLTDSIRTAF